MRCLAAGLGIVVVALAAAACSGSTEQAPAGSGGSAGTGGTVGTGGTGGTAGAGGVSGTGGVAGGTGGIAGAGGDVDAGPCPTQEPWYQSCQSEGVMCTYATTCGKDSTCSCQSGKWNCTPVECADVPSAYCPPSIPSGSCQSPNMQCWYGDDPRPWCRETAICEQGQWMVTAAKCVGPSSQCPVDPNNPPDGVCGNPDPMFCTYGAGYGCDCEWNGGMPPPDGGPYLQWTCFMPPGNGCPDVAPNAGQSCNVLAGKQCAYGPTCSSYLMECQKGLWVLAGQSACG